MPTLQFKGKVFVQNFEQALASSLGQIPDLCVMAPACANNLVIEHDGSVYACDWFTQPKWRLGNLNDTPIAELVATKRMQRFAAEKARVPRPCGDCRWLDRCNGGCPAHRVQANTPRPTWFCRDNKIFFEHAEPTLHRIAARLGLAPT